MKAHDTVIRTRYGETDQMGIIYHPNYYIYFEIGRTEFLREVVGISYKDMEELGVMLPVIETHCIYKIPAKYDDQLIVKTTIKQMTPVRISFSYQLIRVADGAILANGETAHAFVNRNNGRPTNMKKHSSGLFDKIYRFVNCQEE